MHQVAFDRDKLMRGSRIREDGPLFDKYNVDLVSAP